MRPNLLLIVLVVCGCAKEAPHQNGEQPVQRLAEQVEQERRASVESVGGYAPKVQGQIDELAAPAADILRQLPGVAEVEVLVETPQASHRIIQLRDWHYVPPDLFALDVRQVAVRPLSDDEVDDLYWRSSWSSWSRRPSFGAWSNITA
jgi:hypothetical protein